MTFEPQQFEALAAAKIQKDLHQQPAEPAPAPQYEQPVPTPQYEQPAEPAPIPQYEQPAPMPQYEQPAEPAPAPQYEAPQAADPYEMDLRGLWEAFLDRGERQIGAQFFFIRERAVPESLEDGVLRVRVRGAARQYVEDNRNMLSALLSQVAGKMTLLLPVSEDDIPLMQQQAQPPVQPVQPEPDPAETLRSQASDILGLDIKLEQ